MHSMTQRPPIRIVLDEEAFRALVAGAVASFPTLGDRNVEIILSDIGFDRMLIAVEDAIEARQILRNDGG
jgi:hypothetical protein